MCAKSRVMACMLVVLVVLPAAGLAQQGGSDAAATRLVELLKAKGLDTIGARDPATQDRFVAALHVADQLLVVAGHHPAPALLDQRLEMKAYRELYLDLQATPTPKGKLFIMDSGGNGLQVTRQSGLPFDMVYEDGTRSTSFDGDWKGQKLSESEYRQRFAELERQYAHMLSVLIAALEKQEPAQP